MPKNKSKASNTAQPFKKYVKAAATAISSAKNTVMLAAAGN